MTLSPVYSAGLVVSGTCGQELSSPLQVQVRDSLNRPVSGIQVSFRLIAQPDEGEGALLSHSLVNTDSAGLALTELTLGDKAGSYKVVGQDC